MNKDPMATEKVAKAIRRFIVDNRKLEKIVELQVIAKAGPHQRFKAE